MARSGSKSTAATAKRLPPVERWVWAALGLALALGATLRGARLAEAPGGYLVFNEGFYLSAGVADMKRGLLAWFFSPVDLNKPPLFQGLVSTLVRLGAPMVAGPRLISVVAGLASVVLVFLLGRLLFDQRTGLIAASVLAVMPGVVLVDHNIQTDSLLVALILASVYFYVLAAASGRKRDAIISGVLLGLGVLTKEPALLVLPALAGWETWRSGGLAWLREERVRWTAGIGLAMGVSWYAVQWVRAPGEWFAQMFGAEALGRSGMTGISGPFLAGTVDELIWMLFPFAALLALAGLVFAGAKRRAGDKLLLVFVAVYAAFYLAVHLHSYYLLPLAPFLALAIGRLCAGLLRQRVPRTGVRVALVVSLVAAMAFGSVLTMGGQKWGRWSPMSLERKPPAGFTAVRLYFEPAMNGTLGPTTSLMRPELSASPASVADFVTKAPETPGVQNLYLAPDYLDASGKLAYTAVEPVADTWIRPVVFGYAIGQTTLDTGRRQMKAQVFGNQPWTAERVGPSWQFGWHEKPVDSGVRLYDKAGFVAGAGR